MIFLMKRFFIISIFCTFLAAIPVFAKENSGYFKSGVFQYKSGNYAGCMQIMKDITAADPGNALAHYYLAISYTQLGEKEQASKEYSKTVTLNPGSVLASYANQGLKNLGSSASTIGGSSETLPSIPLPSPPTAITSTPGASPEKGFMSDKVKDILMEKKLNGVINDVNNKGSVDSSKLQKIEKLNKSEAPSNEEIVQALRTLSKAGLNPVQGMMNQQNINPEMMQMNMLMNSMGGGNMNNGMNIGMNNYNSMNMLPLMMMSQNSGDGNKNIDPQLMQTMITNMMIPNLNSFSNNNNENNY